MNHKTFISYHHANEQDLKNKIIEKFGGEDFIDVSVSDGDIDTDLKEETIMRKIREEYLQDSTVTLVLVGWETAQRPYVNSEIQASLWDTKYNKHNGVLAVVRDDLYNFMYNISTCHGCDCNENVRIRSSYYDTYLPDLVKKNNAYEGDSCHYNDSQVYCDIVKYSSFLQHPNSYIDAAFNKRDDRSLIIKKQLSDETPRIGQKVANWRCFS